METENTNKKPNILKRTSTQLKNIVSKRPFLSFLITLGLLVALIGISNTLSKPKTETKKEEKPVKEVTTYSIGTAPKFQSQATIKKTGTISIYAQSSGVVQKIYKKEGDTVSKGTNIVWISTNYQGGTLSSIQRQQAQTSYEATKNNFALNQEAIQKQRELAQLTRENTDELRKITEKSIEETSGVIQTSDQVLKSIVDTIETLEASASATNTAQINQLKGQQAQLQGSINQLRNANRNAEYSINQNNPPTELADLQKDLSIKQLDIQERSLTLQLEVSKLSYQLAQISESLNYPTSPVQGKVERINVSVGDTINPGQLLAIVTTADTSAIAESFVTREIASKISLTDPSILYINNQPVEITPAYISTQPTNGQLYNITYQIPDSQTQNVTNASYIKIEIPVGTPDTTASTPFIPIDAIYQTQDGAFVYVAENQNNQYVSKSKKVTLGQVAGSYVQVTNGLTTNDKIITNRTILEGDQLKLKQ